MDESTFEGLDNPELCMKAYLVSRMFNAYTVIYFIERAKNYEEGSQEYQYYMRASGIYKAYNSMSPRFVGTQAFTIFKELVIYCQENEINPLAYLYSQFKLVDYMSQVHKTRKYAIPYVPSLMSAVAKEQHENSEYFIKRMRATTPFYQISKEKAMYTGTDYPIIQSLLYAYTFGKKKLDAPLQDLTLVGSSTKEGQKLIQFYESTKEKIKNNSELLTKERETLNLFLDLQVANLIDDGSMNPMQYTLSFALQLMHAHAIVRYKELPEDHFYIFAGNQRTKNVVTKELVDDVFSTANTPTKALSIISIARDAKRQNLKHLLHKIDQPVLLVWGKQDIVTPPDVAEEFFAHLPNAKLAYIDHCGHVPMMEQPLLFNQHINQFLSA